MGRDITHIYVCICGIGGKPITKRCTDPSQPTILVHHVTCPPALEGQVPVEAEAALPPPPPPCAEEEGEELAEPRARGALFDFGFALASVFAFASDSAMDMDPSDSSTSSPSPD